MRVYANVNYYCECGSVIVEDGDIDPTSMTKVGFCGNTDCDDYQVSKIFRLPEVSFVLQKEGTKAALDLNFDVGERETRNQRLADERERREEQRKKSNIFAR